MYFAQFLEMDSILIALTPTGHSLMRHPTDTALSPRRMVVLQQMTRGEGLRPGQTAWTPEQHFLMRVRTGGEKLGSTVRVWEPCLLK